MRLVIALIVAMVLCYTHTSQALGSRQRMAIFTRPGQVPQPSAMIDAGGYQALNHMPRSQSVKLMARVAKKGAEGGEDPAPKKRATKKKAATKGGDSEGGEDGGEGDLAGAPIDSDLEALLSGDTFKDLIRDLDTTTTPKKSQGRGGKQKQKKAAQIEDEVAELLKGFNLDDIGASSSSSKAANTDLTEADIENALAGIESGEFDVMQFLSDSDSSGTNGTSGSAKKGGGKKGKKNLDTGATAFSQELLSTLSSSSLDASDTGTSESGSDSSEAAELVRLSGKGKKAAPGVAAPLEEDPMVIDGVNLVTNDAAGAGAGGEEFDIDAIDPPPLEEFKKLMESLDDQNSMFEDDNDMFGFFGEEEEEEDDDGEPDSNGEVWYGNEQDGYYKAPAKGDDTEYTNPKAKPWLPVVYDGGKPWRSLPVQMDKTEEMDRWLSLNDKKAEWRVQIVSVVTNSSQNSTALDIVNKVYDFIKAQTDNDDRIEYLTYCVVRDGGESPVPELEDQIQMWLEGYNTYHLVDGAAMKEAWGGIMPHIMLSDNNLQAIVDQVKWALSEDSLEGALLTPRLRRVRFRGGAAEMIMGYNTEDLESEFSIVSVR